jgi:hypothetical protein
MNGTREELSLKVNYTTMDCGACKNSISCMGKVGEDKRLFTRFFLPHPCHINL